MPITQKTLIRDMPNGDRIVAHLELREALPGERFDERGLSPSFSATGELYEKRGTWSGAAAQRNGREPATSGCIHEEILRAFPHLESFVALHLSDPSGLPMHAEANGWYWYCGTRTDIVRPRYCGINGDIYAWRLAERNLPDTIEGRVEYCYQIACEMLRVDEISIEVEPYEPPADAPAWGTPWVESKLAYTERVRTAFTEFVNAQQARWEQEAAAGRALLESL